MLYECDFKLIEAYFKSEFLNYFNIVPHFMVHFLLRLYYTTHNKIWWQKKQKEHKKFTFYAELELACLEIKTRFDRKQTYTQSNIKINSFKTILFIVILVEKPDSHILHIITKIFSCMTS